MEKFIHYAENLRRATIKQSVIIKVLLATTLLLAAANAYLTVHHAAFLIPYGLNKKIAISVNHVTPNYLSYIALADANTYFNVNRQNIDAQNQMFLSRIHPSQTNKIESILYQRNKLYKKQDISQVFYPKNYWVDEKKYQVILKGTLKRWLSGKLIKNKKIQLNIRYMSVLGHLYIKAWSNQDVH